MAELGETNGCGRVTWENNEENGQYGTTMALMLLPHWTDGCMSSMEGLFFEASGTTPYHFLTTAAMSKQSSNPVRELRYVNNDAAVGVDHLQDLGVRYTMVRTPEAKREAAAQPELELVATSGPWEIYEVADSEIVVPLDVQPVVVNRRDGDQRERNLELGTSWFQQPEEWAAIPADDGPEDWQRIDVVVDETRLVPDPSRTGEDVDTRGKQVDIVVPEQPIEAVELPPVEVTDVQMGEQELSFRVDEVGVPVLVKVSYFPNWQVDGAEGPYRIAPNLMVVVPTENGGATALRGEPLRSVLLPADDRRHRAADRLARPRRRELRRPGAGRRRWRAASRPPESGRHASRCHEPPTFAPPELGNGPPGAQ